ncbi:MAG: hypothetical protein H7Y05_11095, partial [Steroidobacteraceae bacterium]|nr:hypothetical protein [Deltaproteobacteria bacterium]
MSPLLERFRTYIPGDIHDVAAKVHLMAGFESCKGNTLADAVWNDDKSALVITFSDGSQTTLLVEGYRLLTKCSCRLWQPARNCPHVVIAWATLKRTVSPGTLAHIKFNQQMLLDMKCYTDREPAPVSSAADGDTAEQRKLKAGLSEARSLRNAHLGGQKLSSVLPKVPPQFRLVIGMGHNSNRFSGRILRDNEIVHGWTAIGIPTDLARFMASNSSYESTPRYFKAFLKMTGGKYPIIFRGAEAHETALVYRGDEPRRACIGFDIGRDEVIVSRSLDNGSPIPVGAVVHDGLLFVPETGSIYPLENRKVWRQWELVVDELDLLNISHPYDESCNEEKKDDDKLYDDSSQSPIITQEIRPLRHAVAVPLSLFNSAGIRLNPELFENMEENYTFLLNGVPVAGPRPEAPSAYLLELPHGVTQPRAPLESLGLCN